MNGSKGVKGSNSIEQFKAALSKGFLRDSDGDDWVRGDGGRDETSHLYCIDVLSQCAG